MIIIQFFLEKIAHSSYLLGGNDTCAIIDPRRDVDIYINTAREMGLEITHILETHIHADFISGHMDLAAKTGAKIFVPASAKCDFEHIPLKEDDTFSIEDMQITVIETPGHTPEHISYIVVDTSRGREPVALFCGDTLFVGDVGRPDLFPGRAVELASKLYDSLHKKIMLLPDFCEIYPAHGAGSLCGRSMEAKRSSTIGYEKLYNYALLIETKDDFIISLTENMPDAPDHFTRCANINKIGPVMVSDLPELKDLETADFYKLTQKDNFIILDIRNFESFGGQHIPSAYNIDVDSNFSTFAGWLLPPEKNILLVTNSYNQAMEIRMRLHRVGLDKVYGNLRKGMFDWVTSGLPTNKIPQLSAHDLNEIIKNNEDFILVDVRTVDEYNDGHIDKAINIPIADLRERYKELDPEKKTVLICGSGQRSSMGCSILQQHNFKKIYNVSGGMTGYKAAGFFKDE